MTLSRGAWKLQQCVLHDFVDVVSGVESTHSQETQNQADNDDYAYDPYYRVHDAPYYVAIEVPFYHCVASPFVR